MKIFLAGGGTGGATAPVLAVAEAIAEMTAQADFFLIGSSGVEKKMIAGSRLRLTYLSIPAGKWRRYFSVMNFFDLFKTAAGFLKSLYLIHRHRPVVIFGAGSFVQVPLCWAGFVMRVPIVIHQPDLDPLLSTRLVAPVAKIITVSFSWSGKHFFGSSGLFKNIKKSKIQVTGNPVRREIFGGSKSMARKIFGLNGDFPVMLVMGGSLGSAKINSVIEAAAPELVKYVQIIHITGDSGRAEPKFEHPHYHVHQYLNDDLKNAYAVADFVVCRAGISTITELSALKLPAIVVPLPNSPQDSNAELLILMRSAVVVPDQSFTTELAVSLARKMIWEGEAVRSMKENIGRLLPPGADKKIAKILFKIYESQQP